MVPVLEAVQDLGAHRGGEEVREEWAQKISPGILSQIGNFDIVDPFPGRAEKLAQRWREKGVNAFSYEGMADDYLDMPADLRILAMDDPTALFRIVSGNSQQRMLQFGILVSSGFPRMGSRILGIGGHLNDGDVEMKEQAKSILAPIAEMTGDRRVTSRVMAARPVESIQMNSTRQALHGELADKIKWYLEGREPTSELFVAETLSPAPPFIYPISPVKLDDNISRDDLRGFALEVAEASDEDSLAVVFYRESPAWVSFNFMVRKLLGWLPRRTIELPVSTRVAKIYADITSPRSNPANSSIFTTD